MKFYIETMLKETIILKSKQAYRFLQQPIATMQDDRIQKIFFQKLAEASGETHKLLPTSPATISGGWADPYENV